MLCENLTSSCLYILYIYTLTHIQIPNQFLTLFHGVLLSLFSCTWPPTRRRRISSDQHVANTTVIKQLQLLLTANIAHFAAIFAVIPTINAIADTNWRYLSLRHRYQVGWLKADTKAIQAIHENVITHNPRVSVSHLDQNTWNLHIKAVSEEDRGGYMCQLNTDPMKSQVSAWNC